MAAFRRRNLISEISRLLLEVDPPRSYCDACLALRFGISLAEAKAVTSALAERPGFSRQRRECAACTRTLDVTSARVRLRRT
jgi:hypothetical protein